MQLSTSISEQHLLIDPDIKQEDWAAQHRRIMLAKRYASKWLKVSRDHGIKHYGIEFVAETEVQMEFSLGDHTQDKIESINPKDKSKAIVTIEGLSGGFTLWYRKMEDEIKSWDDDRSQRLLKLLLPMERLASELRQRLRDQ